MKNIILIFGLCLMLCGCGEDAPPLKPDSTYTPPTYKKNEPAVVATGQTANPQAGTTQTIQPGIAATSTAKDTKTPLQRPSTQILNEAAATIDYGTGATALNVKKKQEDKIQAIQNQYNQGSNKAINGK